MDRLPPPLPFAGQPRTPATPTPFRGLAIAASGMGAQRLRMEVGAENLANAETTRTPDGGPYQRKLVRLEGTPAGGDVVSDATAALGGEADPTARAGEILGGVRVAGVERDPTPGALRFDPSHPDADAAGYVRMPNVDPTQELVNLLEARRLYEANATVFTATKAMLRRAIDI